MPFGSTVPKGGTHKLNEAETFIGPGYYDFPNQFGNQKRSKQHSSSQKKLHKEDEAFISKDPRFA
jgi:hypothetical protein